MPALLFVLLPAIAWADVAPGPDCRCATATMTVPAAVLLLVAALIRR